MGKRIVIGVVLAVLFFSMLYLGKLMQVIVFTWATVWAIHELQRAIEARGYHPFMAPAYVFAAVYVAALALISSDIHWVFLCMLWMLCVVAVIIERIVNNRRTTEDCFLAMGAFVYPLPFFVILLLLGLHFGEAQGIAALMAVFACPLMGDTLAYFIGTFFGKQKLCPEISPKKTVEGSIASLFGSILGGILVYALQPVWGSSLSVVPLLLIGVLCGILGQIGDLFASVIKRWANIKDFGTIFPGHGGILDRVDSVLLCAPAVYVCFHILSVLPR